MEKFGGNVRNGILNLTIKDQQTLYASYMPFIQNGGIFIQTRRNYMLGDEVFLLLDLLEEGEKIPLTGRAVWLTPKGHGSREGVGIQLDESHADVVNKIEAYLAGLLESDKPTLTM